MSELAKVLDVFFNGRPADALKPAPKVTIEELVRRKKSVVCFKGKLYRIEVSKVEAVK